MKTGCVFPLSLRSADQKSFNRSCYSLIVKKDILIYFAYLFIFFVPRCVCMLPADGKINRNWDFFGIVNGFPFNISYIFVIWIIDSCIYLGTII